jgi:hypothetical protein
MEAKEKPEHILHTGTMVKRALSGKSTWHRRTFTLIQVQGRLSNGSLTVVSWHRRTFTLIQVQP